MTVWTVYVLLLKASLTSFSGLGSLPMVRQDFVVTAHALTDHQLSTAVAAGRTGPGPYGLYLVCVGFLAAGVPGDQRNSHSSCRRVVRAGDPAVRPKTQAAS